MKILTNIILISCFLIGSLNNPASAYDTVPTWGDSTVDTPAEAQDSAAGKGDFGAAMQER